MSQDQDDAQQDDAQGALSRRRATLAELTPARIALGRTGASLPMREVLRFGLAHAQARDAVHCPFDAEMITVALGGLVPVVLQVDSAAPDRETYLRRPDLGRRLAPASLAALESHRGGADLAIVVADGLSSTAVHQNAVPLVEALLAQLPGVALAAIVVASQARVALGDDVGQALAARAVLVLIGERPGLSSPDSLGAYLTFAPRSGLTDEARNCVSNIRPGGLRAERAAHKLAWLVREALRRGLTGVALKDDSELALVGTTAATALGGS